jgi:hypothetical protein
MPQHRCERRVCVRAYRQTTFPDRIKTIAQHDTFQHRQHRLFKSVDGGNRAAGYNDLTPLSAIRRGPMSTIAAGEEKGSRKLFGKAEPWRTGSGGGVNASIRLVYVETVVLSSDETRPALHMFGKDHQQFIKGAYIASAFPVCTENLTPDVVMMKSAKNRI